MKQTDKISKEEFRARASEIECTLRTHGEELLKLARLLAVTQDFSPVAMRDAADLAADVRDVMIALKTVAVLTKARGATYFAEQKAELLAGNLRINRRTGTAE